MTSQCASLSTSHLYLLFPNVFQKLSPPSEAPQDWVLLLLFYSWWMSETPWDFPRTEEDLLLMPTALPSPGQTDMRLHLIPLSPGKLKEDSGSSREWVRASNCKTKRTSPRSSTKSSIKVSLPEKQAVLWGNPLYQCHKHSFVNYLKKKKNYHRTVYNLLLRVPF